MLQHVNTHSSDRHLSHHTATVNTNRSVAVAPPAAPPQAAAQALLTLHKQQRESMQQQLSLIQGLLHGDYHSTVQTAQHSTGSRGRGPAPPSHGRRQSVEAPTPRAAPTHLTRPARDPRARPGAMPSARHSLGRSGQLPTAQRSAVHSLGSMPPKADVSKFSNHSSLGSSRGAVDDLMSKQQQRGMLAQQLDVIQQLTRKSATPHPRSVSYTHLTLPTKRIV
eukprot:TRINITY_DN3892_c0_g1_i1.p1 TRINITY_DN3892_c0_g1~~TRINITY_DN3892_c0_g1_i1.p1  ORF type:complete len:222 (-),score=39.90 TRINITY_DN3892_c0_g1_i1:116-781(-)